MVLAFVLDFIGEELMKLVSTRNSELTKTNVVVFSFMFSSHIKFESRWFRLREKKKMLNPLNSLIVE